MFRRLVMTVLVAVFALFSVQQASAQVHVRGHFRSNGTYVAPHYRSYPDGNFYNNWSTYPNVNPYTGERGTRLTPNYSSYSGYSSYGYHRYNFPSPSFPGRSSSHPSFSWPDYRWPR